MKKKLKSILKKLKEEDYLIIRVEDNTMMKKKIKLIGLVVAVVAVEAVMIAQAHGIDNYAYGCSELVNKKPDLNPSLTYACAGFKQYGYNHGAMWLSDSNVYNNVDATVSIGANEFAAGKKTIYLRGAVIGENYSAGEYSADATHIKLIKSDSRIEGIANDDNYDAFKNVPTSISRYGNSYNDPTIWSTATELTLDVNKLLGTEYNGNDCQTNSMVTDCDINLQAFRCYGNQAPSVGNTGCYSDTSVFKVSIKHSFEGKIRILESSDTAVDYRDVPDSIKVDSGWSGKAGFKDDISYTIENCGDTCWAQFRHYLWSDSGYAATRYKIEREVAGSGVAKSKTWGWVSSGEFGGANNKVPLKDVVEMSPGQVVCETLEFYSEQGKTQKIKACVTAKGPSVQGVTRAMKTSNTQEDWKDWKEGGNWWIATNNDDWSGADGRPAEVSGDMTDCASDGCPLQFRHYLKNSQGKDSFVYYKVLRSVDGVETTITGDTLKVFSDTSGHGLQSDVTTIYPGQVICETLYFKQKLTDEYSSYTKACVVAFGTVGSSIAMEVANNSLLTRDSNNEYAGYKDETYIKPGDIVKLRATYNALASYVPNLKPDFVRVDSNSGYMNSGGNQTLREIFNDNIIDRLSWKKAFVAFGSDDDFDVVGYNTILGDGTRVKQEDTAGFKAGTTYTRTAKTDPRDNNGERIYDGDGGVWTSPKEVELTRESNKIVADVKTGSISDDAFIKVPYNFTNSICILKDAGNECQDNNNLVVYAGEDKTIRYKITVGDRKNNLLAATYATNVDHARWKVLVCYSGSCEEKRSSNDVSFNAGESIGEEGIPVDIKDLPAGTEIEIKAMVYPRQSYNDRAMEKRDWEEECRPGIDECWDTSTIMYTVAKKPSFQVWGGSVSANSIETPIAQKTTIEGYSGETRKFGSWTELAVVSENNGGAGFYKNNNVMASGAGFGYSGLGLNGPEANPGGNKDGIYNRLTFGGWAGVNIPTVESVRTALGLKEEDDKKDVDLAGNELNRTTLFYITGDTPITGDITIEKDDNGDIPKVVIYSSGNIDIDCGVEKIDAILIANGDINTCSGLSDEQLRVSASAQQTELTINGAIVAGGILKLNRTYGAASGNASIVPAEIINYDNSMLFIGGSGSGDTSVDPSKLVVQYMRELAPRY